MRLKDLDQAILLEQKLALHAKFLRERGVHGVVYDEASTGAESFLPSIGAYKDLVGDNCDTVELSRIVLEAIQETSNLTAMLYSSATGHELPIRSFHSTNERHSDYQTSKLPTRAETFGGFDERKNKVFPPWRDAVISTINHTISVHSKELSAITSSESDKSVSHSQSIHQDKALAVFHNLNMFLCIINQQMTTINSLQNSLHDNPNKHVYRHNDQLEELRNLQDKFQEEKTAWLKQKESQEKAMDERQQKQESMLEQIRHQQDDLEQQREQWFRKMEKMEKLASQQQQSGILGASNYLGGNSVEDSSKSKSPEVVKIEGTSIRRKDKWSTSTLSKQSTSNQPSPIVPPKSGVKQQLPLKLSSSMKQPERTSLPNTVLSPTHISQILPFKLADKKNSPTGNHTRTGSSPAIIQHPSTSSSAGHSRTNTYPERYRLRSADGHLPNDKTGLLQPNNVRHQTIPSPTSVPSGTSSRPTSDTSSYPSNQEEIYF